MRHYLLVSQHPSEDERQDWLILAHVDFEAIALAKQELVDWYTGELDVDINDVTWTLYRPTLEGEARALRWHTDDMVEVKE